MSVSDADADEVPTLYPSKNRQIIDAVTGFKTGFKIGSKQERLFWKVTDVSVGGGDGYNPKNKIGTTYFYSSPEEYEKTKHVKISKKMKESWKNRHAGSECACLSAHVCTF